MKVMHLLNTGKFSGAENVACQIINLMKNECVCIYCSRDGSIRDVLKEKEISFEPINAMSIAEVKRVIKKFNPELIHAHDMRSSFVASLSCGKIPLVCHIHNNAIDSRKISLKSLLFLFAAIKAKHIFWVSKTAFSGYLFHFLFQKKSSILLNIVNLNEIYKKMNVDTNSYSYDVVYIGRLTFQKNPERLINILRDLRNLCPNYKAAIVGDGPLKDKVEDLIKVYNLGKNISLLGYQSNPLKILHDSKVMLLVSRWEGLPMCVLESLALGVPVISSPTDGIDSVIKDGVNGFICENDAEFLENILFLLKKKDEYSRFVSEAIEFSKIYNDIDSYKCKIESVYNGM